MSVNLTEVSDAELIIALYKRGIDVDYIKGCFMHIMESDGNHSDMIHGSSEEGLHGAGAWR